MAGNKGLESDSTDPEFGYLDSEDKWYELIIELTELREAEYAAQIMRSLPQELRLPFFNLLEKFIFAHKWSVDIRQDPGLHKPYFNLYEQLDQIIEHFMELADLTYPSVHHDQSNLWWTLNRKLENPKCTLTEPQLELIELVAFGFSLTGQGRKLYQLLGLVAKHPQGEKQAAEICDFLTLIPHALRTQINSHVNLSGPDNWEIDLRPFLGAQD